MRAVYLFLLLIVLAVVGWFVAQKAGWIPSNKPPVVAETPITPAEKPAGEQGVNLPRFDLVRVDKFGNAVIAGQAAPGSTVTVYQNGEELGKTVVEGDGSWVIYDVPALDAGPVELTLSMTTSDGFIVKSDESVIIYVPEREGDKPLIMKTTPGGASIILQRPTDPDVSLGPLAIETIDYDNAGSVIFAGRATPGAVVQIFIAGKFLDQTSADENGRWTIQSNIVPGTYTLTIVQLDQFGKPQYALEVPFERASYDDVQFRDGAVVVQPGNSLWVISRRIYGRGAQYTVIYEANAEQIRDPDLIYPGQIFQVPESGDESDDGEGDQ